MCRYASNKRCADFSLKMQQVFGGPHLLGELTALSQNPSLIQVAKAGTRKGEMGSDVTIWLFRFSIDFDSILAKNCDFDSILGVTSRAPRGTQ